MAMVSITMLVWKIIRIFSSAPCAQSAETRSIEDLLDFIDGKADDALRELKVGTVQKNTEKGRIWEKHVWKS